LGTGRREGTGSPFMSLPNAGWIGIAKLRRGVPDLRISVCMKGCNRAGIVAPKKWGKQLMLFMMDSPGPRGL